jgi:hypothetical protein
MFIDHFYKSLQHNDKLGLSVRLTVDYDSFDKALEWLLQNGRDITLRFQDTHNQPCALTVLERSFANEHFDDYIESNALESYWLK